MRIIKNLKEQKKVKVLFAAAEFIDSIVLYLEAGYNILHSFQLASQHIQHPLLKSKCEIVISYYDLGCSLQEAFKMSIQDNGGDVFAEIAENILLSLQIGSPLLQNLVNLSENMQLMANSELHEMVAKAPIKMIFPLVICIFPVIFIMLGSGPMGSFFESLVN